MAHPDTAPHDAAPPRSGRRWPRRLLLALLAAWLVLLVATDVLLTVSASGEEALPPDAAVLVLDSLNGDVSLVVDPTADPVVTWRSEHFLLTPDPTIEVDGTEVVGTTNCPMDNLLGLGHCAVRLAATTGAGDVTVDTVNGDVDIDLVTPPDRIVVDSVTGDVTLRVPQGAYDLAVEAGGVETVDVTVDPDSPYRIELETGGDVAVSQRR